MLSRNRISIFLLFFLAAAPAVLAQQPPVRLEYESIVDTSQADIREVLGLWKNYLNSKPDSDYVNPYWSEEEQRRYHPYDLLAHTWWDVSPYLFCAAPGWKMQVLSVSRAGEDFIIRSMLYHTRGDSGSKAGVLGIFRVGARKEKGSYKLCNALPIATRDWSRQSIGQITFVCPPGHAFNKTLAGRMTAFVDSIASAWHAKLPPVEYYFADDLEPVARALGFDYFPAEGNVSGPRGFVDPKNHIVYAGGADEWYPHEFIHILVNPDYPKAHGYLLEGYATMAGGSMGNSLDYHLRRNLASLRANPQKDILHFKGVDLHVGPAYVIGGLLCRLALEKGGLPQLQRMMKYGKTDDDLYRAIKDAFGVDKDHLDDFLLSAMSRYVEQ